MIDITSKTEEGFKDIILSVERLIKDDKGNLGIVAKGKYKDKTVGLLILVKGGMENGIKDGAFDRQAIYTGGIMFKSIGVESDNLVEALAELYEVKNKKRFSGHLIMFTCCALEEKELDLENRPARFKLFFDDNDSLGLYCELFCNINIPAKEVQIPEKDQEYRGNIIKALTL